MSVEAREVRSRLEVAYSEFLRKDAQLLIADANERSLTHKLAEYIQVAFPDWHVDCEYNRDGGVPKRLVGEIRSVETDDTDGQTVYPDIIVHRRGERENLIVIEAKKSTTANNSTDKRKLGAYKAELGYTFAYVVVFPVGAAANRADFERDVQEVEA